MPKILNRNSVIFLILAVLIFLVYANSLPNSFVTDDEGLAKEGAKLLTWGRIFQDWSAPLRTLVYSVTYLLFDLQPWAYRLSNIFFHLGTTFLAFLIVKNLVNRPVALLTGLLFAVHPLLSEAVVWVSGGGYIQFSFFFLLSFYLYINPSKRKYFYHLSLLSFVLALLSLNRGLVLAAVFPLYELCFGDLRKNWKKTIPFFMISALWLLTFFAKIGERATSLEDVYYRDGKYYNPFIQWPLAIGSYLQLLFWPGHLTYVHTNNQTIVEYLFRIGILLSYLTALVFTFVKKKHWFFWLAFFLVPLLPTLTPFKIAFIVAERYVYLGSLGMIVLFSMVMIRILNLKEFRLAAYSLLVIGLLGLGIRTAVRNTDWATPNKLWEKTTEVSSDSSQAHLNLGVKYGKEGNYQKAEEEFLKAILINPKIPEFYYNLGVVYLKSGRNKEALQQFQKALQLRSDYPEAQKGVDLLTKPKN